MEPRPEAAAVTAALKNCGFPRFTGACGGRAPRRGEWSRSCEWAEGGEWMGDGIEIETRRARGAARGRRADARAVGAGRRGPCGGDVRHVMAGRRRPVDGRDELEQR